MFAITCGTLCLVVVVLLKTLIIWWLKRTQHAWQGPGVEEWKVEAMELEQESHLWKTPRGGWISVFFKQLEMVSHKYSQSPCFCLIKWSCFSTLWTNKQIASNNGCTNTFPNKLFNVNHMQMRQHSPNIIFKKLHQYKNSFSHAPYHQSTTTNIYLVLSKIQ